MASRTWRKTWWRAIGALASPTSTLEELALLKKLTAGLGFSRTLISAAPPRLFVPTANAGRRGWACRSPKSRILTRLVVVGSFIRRGSTAVGAASAPGRERKVCVSVNVGGDDQLIFGAQTTRFAVRHGRRRSQPSVKAVAHAEKERSGTGRARCSAIGPLLPMKRSPRRACQRAKSRRHFPRQRRRQRPGLAGSLHALALELAKLTGASFGFPRRSDQQRWRLCCRRAVPAAGGSERRLPMISATAAYDPEPGPAGPCQSGGASRPAQSSAALVDLPRSKFGAAAAVRRCGIAAGRRPLPRPQAPSSVPRRAQSFMVSSNRSVMRVGLEGAARAGEPYSGSPGFRLRFRRGRCVTDAHSSRLAFVAGLDGNLALRCRLAPQACWFATMLPTCRSHFADPLASRSPGTARLATLRQRARMAAAAATMGWPTGPCAQVRRALALRRSDCEGMIPFPAGCVRVAAAHRLDCRLGEMFGDSAWAWNGRCVQQAWRVFFGPIPGWPSGRWLKMSRSIIAPLMLAVAYLTFGKRKVIGWMRVRIGPNRSVPGA